VRRTCALIILACALFALAMSTHAVASAQDVSWRAPASCPREAFDAELARLLAGNTVRFDASVQLTPRSAGWSTTVTVDDATRKLQLATCAEAQRTAALLIATAIAPERMAAVAPEPPVVESTSAASPPEKLTPEKLTPLESAPVASAPRESAPVASEAAPEPPITAPASPRDLRLRLGALLALFSLPDVSGGPTLGVEYVRWGLVSWIDARYLVARRTGDNDSSLLADVDLFAAGLGAAWLWKLGPVQLGPLLELEAGLLRARGQGERNAQAAASAWLAPALGARVDTQLSRRTAASLYGAASLPLWRPGVQLGDEAAFYTTPPSGFRLGFVIRVGIGSTKAQNGGQ
jgi:hypothetical protein